MILRVAGPILLVKGYSCGVFCVEQAGAGVAVGTGGRRSSGYSFEKSDYQSVMHV
jgi:hypothetical protein